MFSCCVAFRWLSARPGVSAGYSVFMLLWAMFTSQLQLHVMNIIATREFVLLWCEDVICIIHVVLKILFANIRVALVTVASDKLWRVTFFFSVSVALNTLPNTCREERARDKRTFWTRLITWQRSYIHLLLFHYSIISTHRRRFNAPRVLSQQPGF